jgi:hypothetical protein
VLHIRLRKGSANTSRGMQRFCDELSARVQGARAIGPKLLRADSGFWSNDTFERLEGPGRQFSIGVRLQPHVRAAIEGSPGRAGAVLGAGCVPHHRTELLTVWRPNIASRPSSSSPSATSKTTGSHTSPLGAPSPTPRGRSSPRSPTTCAGPACWASPTGPSPRPGTPRRRLLALPGRLTRTARRWTLHLPAGWPCPGRSRSSSARPRPRAACGRLPAARILERSDTCRARRPAHDARARSQETATRASPPPQDAAGAGWRQATGSTPFKPVAGACACRTPRRRWIDA